MALTKITGEGIGTVDSAVVDNITINGNDISSTNSDGDIIFKGNDGGSTIEAARLDMSLAGMFLLGKTASAADTKGVELHNGGSIVATVDDGVVLFANRENGSGGNVIQIRQDNTATGFIATPTTASNDVSFASSRGGGIRLSDQEFIPCDANGGLRNNAIDLGHPSALFDDIRATNSSIITSSDETLKQDIEELSDKEKKVAIACKGLMRKYRWKSRVEEKGDDARIHFGIMAQDLQDAFLAEGLDPTKYAMFCSDTVWEIDEKTVEDGKEIIRKNSFKVESEAPEGSTKRVVLAVRYTELLAFIISAT